MPRQKKGTKESATPEPAFQRPIEFHFDPVLVIQSFRRCLKVPHQASISKAEDDDYDDDELPNGLEERPESVKEETDAGGLTPAERVAMLITEPIKAEISDRSNIDRKADGKHRRKSSVGDNVKKLLTTCGPCSPCTPCAPKDRKSSRKWSAKQTSVHPAGSHQSSGKIKSLFGKNKKREHEKPTSNVIREPVYTFYYVEAMKEVTKLLYQCGRTLRETAEILDQETQRMDFHLSGKNGQHYEEVELMVSYEMKMRLIQKKDPYSGTATMVFMNRILHFTLEFLKLIQSNPKGSSSEAVKKAYERSIGTYYNWVVNKMAAMYVSKVPPMKEVIQHLTMDGLHDTKEITKRLIDAIQPVADATHSIFHRHNQLKCI